MACGCQSACGCIVIGDGVTTSVVRDGDTFTVSATQFVDSVADTDCISLAVDTGELTATPVIDPNTECVELACGVDGLRADLVLDPASTAIVSCSVDGLRVDVPPSPPLPESAQPGDYLFHAGIGTRTGYIDADGSDVDRASYASLWNALSLFGSIGVRTIGSPIIDAITDTRFMRPGLVVEATSFAPGTTIVSVNSPTQITVSTNATTNGADTEVRAYLYGAGDGITTFNVPDMNRAFGLGIDHLSIVGETLGAQGGLEDVTLGITQIPSHVHNVLANQAAHIHTGTTDAAGAHNHEPGTTTRSFITADTASIQQVAISNVDGDHLAVVTGDPLTYPDGVQLNNETTDTEPDHTHTFTTGATDPTITVTEDAIGGGLSHENMPPYTVGRWLVKT